MLTSFGAGDEAVQNDYDELQDSNITGLRSEEDDDGDETEVESQIRDQRELYEPEATWAELETSCWQALTKALNLALDQENLRLD